MTNYSLNKSPCYSALAEGDSYYRVYQKWFGCQIPNENFYQTGYETIVFTHSREFALFTALSSIIPWDSDIYLKADQPQQTLISNIATQLGINCLPLSNNHDGLSHFAKMAINKKECLYLLINISPGNNLPTREVDIILSLAQKTKLTLIIDSQSDIEGINDQFCGAIDFLLGELNEHQSQSFIVARRSLLVQTEGNARSKIHDLYAYWQWAMRNRTPIIEPLCG